MDEQPPHVRPASLWRCPTTVRLAAMMGLAPRPDRDLTS